MLFFMFSLYIKLLMLAINIVICLMLNKVICICIVLYSLIGNKIIH